MAKTKINIDEIGEIFIFRRRGLKNIRVRVDNKGHINLSLPWYVPKSVGVNFVKSKQTWLKSQQSDRRLVFKTGTVIADFKLEIIESDKSRSSSKITESILKINIPKKMDGDARHRVVERIIATTLKTKTEEVLIPKTMDMANKHGFKVKSIEVRKLKSRWGSCDHNKNLTLNLYLYCLPEVLYSYVIFHELAHTQELNHSKKFWDMVQSLEPNYKILRKQLHNFSPGLFVQ